MTQIEQAWGAPASDRYEELAAPFRPIFADIAADAVEREQEHRLPWEELRRLKEAGFSRLRLPRELGGSGVTLPELFNLLIELGAADTSVINALRAHLGFVEDLLNLPPSPGRDRWLRRVAEGETVGSGVSELGDGVVGTVTTRLTREAEPWRLNGRKFYTSGSLYADWINVSVHDDAGEALNLLVPTRVPGVEILDDWDGFGQTLSASGTATFTDVAVTSANVSPVQQRFRYATGFFQIVHLATLAGIGRAAANELAKLVAGRKRVYAHGNGAETAQDPQVLQIVGRVRGAAYGAGATVLKAAASLQRVHEARIAGDAEAEEKAGGISDIENSQAVTVVTDLILDAVTLLFDGLGASAVKRGHGLDRHWRNARTISSHNPRIFHHRWTGDFAVNGRFPPRNWGRPAAKPAGWAAAAAAQSESGQANAPSVGAASPPSIPPLAWSRR